MTAEVAILPAPDRAGATAWTTAWVTAELSRHERKKLATRAALSNAAWSLMIEHGLDAVTPEAVAAAVDVSPQTFRGHFATREEAILDGLARRAVSLVGTVRDRPAGEPVWDSLERVLPTAVAGCVGRRGDLAVLTSAVRQSPALTAQCLVTLERTHWLLAEAIAERTGADLDRDLVPRLMADAVVVGVSTAVQMWTDGDLDAALPDLLHDAFALLRAGLPQDS
ncbi:TetR/AcrR family transcriptional regulator [Actinomycetes bacterium KLBMP 9797]